MNPMQGQQLFGPGQQQSLSQQQQSQQAQSYQVSSPILQQQGIMQRNSPHLQQVQQIQQAQQRQIGVSPQVIQRATPSPSAMLLSGGAAGPGGQPPMRRTPPNNNNAHMLMQPQQQQSPLAIQAGGPGTVRTSGPTFVQYARPGSAASAVYPNPGTPQQQIQQPPTSQQQQIMMSQQTGQQPQQTAMYRQMIPSPQQPQQAQQQQQPGRYAYVQNSDGTMQTVSGNRVQVVAQQMQPQRYGSPHMSQHPQQLQAQQQYSNNMQQVVVSSPMTLQQQQHQYTVQQQQIQQGHSQPQSQQQRAPQHQQQHPQYIVLPSGQQAHIVPANAVMSQTQHSSQAILIASSGSQPPAQHVQDSTYATAVYQPASDAAPTGAQQPLGSYQVYQQGGTQVMTGGMQQAIVIASSDGSNNVAMTGAATGGIGGSMSTSPQAQAQMQYFAQQQQQQPQQQQKPQQPQQHQQPQLPTGPKSKMPNKNAGGGKNAKNSAAWKNRGELPAGTFGESGTVTAAAFDGMNDALVDGHSAAQVTTNNAGPTEDKVSPAQLAEAVSHTTLFDRSQLEALLKTVDEHAVLEDESSNALHALMDEFVNDLIDATIGVCRHRVANGGDSILRASDLRFVLQQRDYGVQAPPVGAQTDSMATTSSSSQSRRLTTTAHERRMALIHRTLKRN